MVAIQNDLWRLALLDVTDGTVRWLPIQQRLSMRPTWLPDGETLIFHGVDSLYRYNMPAETLTRLAGGWASASPDGARVAFEMISSGRGRELYVLDLATGALNQLTSNGVDDGVPTWLPDGQRIVFESSRDGDFDLYLMDVATGAVERLTNLPDDETSAAWQPR